MLLLCSYQVLIALSDNISILPLGDSITAGFHEKPNGNYRFVLENLLKADGFSVDFVGTQQRNSFFEDGKEVLDDPQHEGYPGIKVEYLIEDINYDALPADVITLLIGTNNHWETPDLEAFVEKYERLFNLLESYQHVFVATIPKFGYNNLNKPYWTDAWVENRNKVVIPNMNTAIRIAAHGRSNFTLVEYYDSFNEYIHLTADKIHPNILGQHVLGILFYRAISEWAGNRKFDALTVFRLPRVELANYSFIAHERIIYSVEFSDTTQVWETVTAEFMGNGKIKHFVTKIEDGTCGFWRVKQRPSK